MTTSRRFAPTGMRGFFVILSVAWCAAVLYLLAMAASRMVDGDVSSSLVGLVAGLLVLTPGLWLLARVGQFAGVIRRPPVLRVDAALEYRYPLKEGVGGPGW